VPDEPRADVLAIGDALSVAVLEAKGFTDRDFAQLHPGGALGRKLLRVEEVMHHDGQVPVVPASATLAETLRAITQGGFGTVGVVEDGDGRLAGVITDGDVRRAVLKLGDVSATTAAELMSRNPKTVAAEALVEEALATMEKHAITSLFILETATRRPIGIVHLHDLLKASVA
jgi:arabinose-5-phosphate isomerase